MTTPWSSMVKRIEEIEATQGETTLDGERWEIVEPETDEPEIVGPETDDVEEGGDHA